MTNQEDEQAAGLMQDRRTFIKTGAAAVTIGYVSAAAGQMNVIGDADYDFGLAMVYYPELAALHVIDLQSNKVVYEHRNYMATHAVVPVESQNRFVVQGRRPDTGSGALAAFDIDLRKRTCKPVLDVDLAGGRPLHWQPTRDFSSIVFNTVRDGALHELDTKSLEMKRHEGGGNHSNMAFFENYIVATDNFRGDTKLRVVDRDSGTIVSETAVGSGGHGVAVNEDRARAYVWSWQGLHVVSLAERTLGMHLGVLKRPRKERSWFSWTPQGGRYSHDTAWLPGDLYREYLLVIDTDKDRFEQLPLPAGKTAGYLQISPDGSTGIASVREDAEVAVFDIEANQCTGVIAAGKADGSFFDRDMGFCSNRRYAVVTNTLENSLSLLDLALMQEVRRVNCPATPSWMKVLS